MRKIVTLVFALVVTSCWAHEPDSISYGACIMRDGHVLIAVFVTHSPSEAVIADIARQLLEQ